MKRKTFINQLTLAGGSAIFLPSVSLFQSCKYEPKIRITLTEADIPLLDEIGETIIPATHSSPGAKSVNVGEYILLMYNDCMTTEEKAILKNGLNALDGLSAKTFSKSFPDAKSTQKLELLKDLQAEAIAYDLHMDETEKPLPHYFNILKSLTISGYFSSETGMTQARNYLPLPGKFEACIPYNQGDRPWAT